MRLASSKDNGVRQFMHSANRKTSRLETVPQKNRPDDQWVSAALRAPVNTTILFYGQPDRIWNIRVQKRNAVTIQKNIGHSWA